VGNPLNPLYDAVAWVFTHIYNVLSPAFGPRSGWTWALTIVLLVVLMRLIMVPLFIKQMHTTRAMTSLAPQMTVLRKKYKNDKQTLNQEMMKLYQQAGVNPLMGCLPVVAQLPMFFALFSVLKAIAEWTSGTPKYHLPLSMVENAKHAQILGANVADKVLFTHGVYVPTHAKITIVGAVVVSMVTTYLTVRQSMKRGMMPAANSDNPMGQSQKYMVYIMPFFALSGLYWPFGLVLYWVTTNLWTLGQQFVLFRLYPQPPAVTAEAGGSAAPGVTGRSQPSLEGPASNGRGPRSAPGSAAPGAAGAAKTGTGKGSTSKPGPARPGQSARPGTTPKSGSPAKGSTANGSPAKGGAANGGPAKGGAANGGPAKGAARQNGRGPATPPPAGQPPSGGGMLRRLGKGRAEPEIQPVEPEVKLVRQQPQRQSRSKRSGRR
jgi:YidC/Oxa1 family membrane protein insertase